MVAPFFAGGACPSLICINTLLSGPFVEKSKEVLATNEEEVGGVENGNLRLCKPARK